MNKIIDSKYDKPFDFDEVPKELHNVELTEGQLERLAHGLETGLIEGIVLEDDSVVNAKISLSRNDESGLVEINYNIQEETLEIPEVILGVNLSKEQKQLLKDGELISGFKVNGEGLHIGVDPELRKVVVKSDRDLGIPNKLLDCELSEFDKITLVNGRKTTTKLFKTSNGDHFTARIGITRDSKGVEFTEITAIKDLGRVDKLRKELNTARVITDEKYLLNMPAITANQDHSKRTYKPIEPASYKIKSIKDIRIDRERENNNIEVAKSNNETLRVSKQQGNINYRVGAKKKQGHIKYKSVSGDDKGFSITPEKSKSAFLKDTFKGVKITNEQKEKFAKGQKVLIKGAQFKDGKKDVFVFKDKAGNFKTKYAEEKSNEREI